MFYPNGHAEEQCRDGNQRQLALQTVMLVVMVLMMMLVAALVFVMMM